MAFAPTPVDDGPAAAPAADPIALVLAEQLTDQMFMASATSARSVQAGIGPSELGTPCDRQLVYRLRGHRRVNHPDPLRVLFGSGMHDELEEMFGRIDGGADRYLIERQVSYRDVFGVVDLYDARRQVVIDWKSSTKRRISEIRRKGPQDKYRIQAHTYGAALAAEGFTVRTVALVFVPMDGDLPDVHVWTEPLDVSVADAAIDRLAALGARVDQGEGIADVQAKPSKLCPWCSYHLPGSVDPETGCPGDSIAITTTKE